MHRLEFQDIRPRTPSGHAPKGTQGAPVRVSADIFRDGHDSVAARIRWRASGSKEWRTAPLTALPNDRFEGSFVPDSIGPHEWQLEAWTDRFGTWRHHTELRAAASAPDLDVELAVGADILDSLVSRVPKEHRARLKDAVATLRSTTCTARTKLDAGLDDFLAEVVEGVPDPDDLTRTRTFGLWVDRPLGAFSAWYELFPRSEGGFLGAIDRLPAVAEMGFDIVYLPPIHPIGRTHRKGRGNTLTPAADDPGSPWAIGAEEGGHTAVHPELGTIEDFASFVDAARRLGLEVALDYALQASPDHPWVRDHPEWFQVRPDGSIRYAENPPKKYQDIHPINFWPARDEDRRALWEACRDVLEFWIGHGVKVFRVDNPHTKPFAFWEWVIADIRSRHPETLFLAEAFTRPKVMHTLAALGFSQSYTYFTWRTERWELQEYGEELATGPGIDYFRPNFWPNTPDILSGPLRDGPPSAFRVRAVLAATMSPNWGMYSGYELCENAPASDANEEYLDSEKYEIKKRDWSDPASLEPFITQLNLARRSQPALRELATLRFHGSTDDEHLLVYSKTAPDGSAPVLVVVNLDPHSPREGLLRLDLPALGLGWDDTYVVTDLLGGASYQWQGAEPYVRLDPGAGKEAHLFTVTQPA